MFNLSSIFSFTLLIVSEGSTSIKPVFVSPAKTLLTKMILIFCVSVPILGGETMDRDS